MGLRTLAEKGCGLTDALAEYMKQQLLREQLALSREELAVNKGLREAQANYYNANADYLTRSQGKNTGGTGGPGKVKLKFDTIYIPNADGKMIPVRQAINTETGEVVSEQRFDPGSTKDAPKAPAIEKPSFWDKPIDNLFGNAGTTSAPTSVDLQSAAAAELKRRRGQ